MFMNKKRKKFIYFLLIAFIVVILYFSKTRKKFKYDIKYFVDNPNLPKYIRYECVKSPLSGCGGWADRVKGILSVYAWGLLTNRKFLIKFEDPCKIDNILLPNEVDWNIKLNYSDNLMTKQDIFMYYDQEYMKNLEYLDILNNYTNAQLLNVRSALMFLDSFSKNSKLYQRITELGYKPEEFKLNKLFYKFYNKLFKLAPSLQKEYDKFLSQAKPSKKSKLICAQLRIGSAKTDTQFMNRKDSILYWKFINETFLYNLKEKNFKIYVTSDLEEIKYEAQQVFGKKSVVFYKESSLHIENDFKNLKQNPKCDSIQNVLLDFHSLQNCDYAVISHSGFGVLGMWNRPVPAKNVYVYTNLESIKKDYWKRDRLDFLKIEDFDKFYFL